MKIMQKIFAFGLLMAAGLIIAGCSETDTTTTPATTPPAGGSEDKAMEKKDENAATSLKGDFQLVSLNVPNMT